MSDFAYRDVRAFGKRVHRLGLAGNYGIDEKGIHAAFARGVNYVFWNPTARVLTKALRSLPAAEKEKLVIATGPSLGFFAGAFRRRVERSLAVLKLERLDVLQLFWLGKSSAWTDGVVDELVKLRDEGKVRAIGVAIHDRPRAGRLAEDSPLDMLMIRYNAAHPGAEREIFPHLEKRRPAVVAYTATSWGRLLRRPRGWKGPVPSAGDCYRFCLSNPAVDVVLNGPASLSELEENLAAVEKGPLSSAEMSDVRAFGKAVHG